MPIGVNRKAVQEYRLEGDETGTVFHWKRLDRELRNHLANKAAKATGTMQASTDQKNDPKFMEYFEDVVRFSLTGWDDFSDADGKPILYGSKEVSVSGVGTRTAMNSSLLDYFAKEWITEMGNHFTDEGSLPKAQEKNSEPPSK